MPKKQTFTEETTEGKLVEWEVVHAFNCTYPIKKGAKCYICKSGKDYTLITEAGKTKK